MVRYTDHSKVSGYAVKAPPISGQTISGYGGKIPTRYLIRYEGRAHRVYAMSYGNAASVYILVKGQTLFLDTDTEHGLEEAGK